MAAASLFAGCALMGKGGKAARDINPKAVLALYFGSSW